MGFIENLAGKAISRDVSLEAVPVAQRRAAVDRAMERLSAAAREQFPSGEGYSHQDKELLAFWAWPKGAQNEAEARKYAGAETVALAKSRSVSVRRGMTRGITIALTTVDRAQSGLKLNAHLENRLAMVLAMTALFGVMLGAVALALVSQGADWRVRPLVIAALIGMIAGAFVAVLMIRVSAMLASAFGDPIKAAEGEQHADQVTAAVDTAVRSS